jgi:8-amino-7-oxononanoate synthase
MNPRQEFEQQLATALAELREARLLREMRLPCGIDLVSNDYLGLATHPYICDAMRAALIEVAAGSGGSRLLHGHHEIFEHIEERLAQFTGSESALLFGSGYAANIGLLQAIAAPGDLIVSDERNHASLIDGIRLTKATTIIYPHQDLDALELALSRSRKGRAVVVTESVFSMDGDLTPLRDVCDIANRNDAVVIVDEAHATGMYGARGSGRVEELGLRDCVVATIHTGGKALGSGGAWIAGSRALRDVMVNRARSFIFSTAPLPVLGSALGAALDLVEREPDRRSEVHRKATLLRRALCEVGINAPGESMIVPIIVGANEAALELQSALTTAGFDARAIRPPSVPPGTARLRVTVRYPVTDADLLRFASTLSVLLRHPLGSDPGTVRGSDPTQQLSRIR